MKSYVFSARSVSGGDDNEVDSKRTRTVKSNNKHRPV